MKVAIEVAHLLPSLLASQNMSLKQRLLHVCRKIRRCAFGGGAPVVVLWCCGGVVVGLWWCCGGAVVVLWWWCGAVVVVWFCGGGVVLLLWLLFGSGVVLLNMENYEDDPVTLTCRNSNEEHSQPYSAATHFGGVTDWHQEPKQSCLLHHPSVQPIPQCTLTSEQGESFGEEPMRRYPNGGWYHESSYMWIRWTHPCTTNAMEDQPLPDDASPAALSPGYVPDSDPEEDPEEDSEEHADYPADGGDGDDEPSGDDSDDDTDDDDEEPFEDEEDDEEEE
ncbi:hypothetical protein Tco_0009612 [Tanacetum coccineum]